MHIMEGFLDIWWCLFWYILCIPFLVIGTWKLRKLFQQHPEKKMTVAISGAFIFVLSSLKLPSVTGSSSHPTGTGLSTMLSGPWITSVLATIVLLFQALLLAHGGITTLGANVFSMGIVGPMVAFGAYRAMVRTGVHPVATVFVTAFLADISTYMMTSIQLALAYPSDGSVIVSLATFLGIFALTQIPLAIVESVLVVMFVDYLSKMRPELLKEDMRIMKGRLVGIGGRMLIGAVVALSIIAVPLLLYEGHVFQGADDKGGNAIQEIDPTYQPWFESLFTPPAGTEAYFFALQMFIGVAVIVAVLYLARKKYGKRRGKGGRTRFGIDDLAYRSPMRDWPPLGKFLLALSLLVVSLISASLYGPLMVLIIGSGLLFYSTRLRFPRIIALALLDGLVVILVGCLVIALLTTGPLIYGRYSFFGLHITLHVNGLNLATMVLLRALAGMTVMLAFITSTPVPHFALALRQLRMPKEISELTVLIYRYSFLLLEQLDTMYLAASCRLGFRGTRNKVRTSSKLAVGLFTRSVEIAERSQIALQCRNFNGDFPTFRKPARLGVIWTVIPLGLALTIYIWTMVLNNFVYLGW